MRDCGHRCCHIRTNGYHRHVDAPATCPHCARATLLADTGPPAGESVVLARIVSDVLARVAPEIPGLPAGAELAELVTGHALAVFAAGLVDPELHGLGERERRAVLAARVGLALAFPQGA